MYYIIKKAINTGLKVTSQNVSALTERGRISINEHFFENKKALVPISHNSIFRRSHLIQFETTPRRPGIDNAVNISRSEKRLSTKDRRF